MNSTQHLHRSGEGERLTEPPSLRRVEAILRGAGMPSDEIRTVMTRAEPELIHRYLELHLERLEEWLVDQRVSLATAERLLTLSRPPPDPTDLGSAGTSDVEDREVAPTRR